MKRRTFIKKTGTAGLLTLITPSGILESLAAAGESGLEKKFRDPPVSAHPHCFWFWMNGHVSEEGITHDLESMKKAGIGGVFNFDAGTGIPKGPVEYGSLDWLQLKEHAIRECERLGLQFSMHNCPGWSSSGGPWITPELSMQQLTWSEYYTKGGEYIDRQLPLPFHKLDFYRDVAVLAYPSMEAEKPLTAVRAQTAKGDVSAARISGEDPEGIAVYPVEEGSKAWLSFGFEKPFELRSVTFLITAADKTLPDDGKRTSVILESSMDGREYQTLATISTGLESELKAGDKFITYDVVPVEAKYFRFSSKQPRRYRQVRFSGYKRLEKFLEKSGSRFMFGAEDTSPLYSESSEIMGAGSVIDPAAIVDISSFMNADGRLQWKAPQGNWTILRFGHTSTGALNKAAPSAGTGLECDKFDASALDFHFSRMMSAFLPLLENLASRGRVGIEIDSYEAGPQNWTSKLPYEFSQRRGYELVKYLPALTGRVIRSVDHTERFLWDFRRTLAGLMAQNYYDRFRLLCQGHGFLAHVEPYDKGPFEEMQAGAMADVSMGEYWFGLSAILQGNRLIQRTPKLASSIAHTNGKKIVAAESFTSEPASSRWQEYPFSLKALGDKLFTLGINKIIIHRFAHQPNVHALPGMTMGPWGIHFDGTNTWFDKSGGWMRYLARCQAMLQEGNFVADLLYFTGEEANCYTRVNPGELYPAPPPGYNYDLVNADTIINKMKIRNGRIELPGGATYRILVFQNYRSVSPELLNKLNQLLKEGLILVGRKPEHSLGLLSEEDEKAFSRLLDDTWQNSTGIGKVFTDDSLQAVLEHLSIDPDVEINSGSGDAPVLHIHYKSGTTDIYFICNQRRTHEELVCTFRINNRRPELWDAVNGSIVPLQVYESSGKTVTLPLSLDPYGSAFIVFRTPATSESIQSITRNERKYLDTSSILKPRRLFPGVKNDFIISLFAKPEINVMMEPGMHMGSVKEPWTEFYAIYPSSGRLLYGEGHAVCGLAIGRNGVVVWENENGTPRQVLLAPIPVSGWTHVALVYRKRKPFVFVNGEFIAEGFAGNKIIHPGLGETFLSEGASYYNGDMTEPELFTGHLDDARIRELSGKNFAPVNPRVGLIQTVDKKGKPSLLINENGVYAIHFKKGRVRNFSVTNLQKPFYLDGPWQVKFPAGRGAPAQISLNSLVSLHRHEVDGVRYFSGTARYTQIFQLPSAYLSSGNLLFLDLGRVEVVAEVFVNGKAAGLLWKRPYNVDITSLVKPGKNSLEIRVTNLWPNRLIGDEQLPDLYEYGMTDSSGFEQLAGSGVEKLVGQPIKQLPDWYPEGKPKPEGDRICFTTWKHFTKDDPLLESGLIGPVCIRTAVLKRLD